MSPTVGVTAADARFPAVDAKDASDADHHKHRCAAIRTPDAVYLALTILRLIEQIAVKLNYRDRRDALADMTASILCLARQGPVPGFVTIENTPLPALPAKPDQPNLL